MAIDPNHAPPLPGGFIRDGQTDYSRMLVVNNDGSINTKSAGTGPTSDQVQGTAADGAAAVGNPVQIGGVDTNGNIQAAAISTLGNLQITGGVAAGVADVGNPVKIGGVYNSTLPTYTTGQRGDAQIDSNGNTRSTIVGVSTTGIDTVSNTNAIIRVTRNNNDTLAGYLGTMGLSYNNTTWDRNRGDANGQLVQPFAMSSSRWAYAAAASGISNTTAAVTFIAAAGGSVRNYVTGIQLDAGVLGAASEIVIRDGAGGTVLWRGFVSTAGYPNGRQIIFEVPLRGSANTLLEVATLTASITGALYFNAQGFQGI